MFQYSHAKTWPTQAYSLKRWTRITKEHVMYTANQRVALDLPALDVYGPRYSLEYWCTSAMRTTWLCSPS